MNMYSVRRTLCNIIRKPYIARIQQNGSLRKNIYKPKFKTVVFVASGVSLMSLVPAKLNNDCDAVASIYGVLRFFRSGNLPKDFIMNKLNKDFIIQITISWLVDINRLLFFNAGTE